MATVSECLRPQIEVNPFCLTKENSFAWAPTYPKEKSKQTGAHMPELKQHSKYNGNNSSIISFNGRQLQMPQFMWPFTSNKGCGM